MFTRGDWLKMNPSMKPATSLKLKSCNVIRSNLLLRYKPRTLLEVDVYSFTKIERFLFFKDIDLSLIDLLLFF